MVDHLCHNIIWALYNRRQLLILLIRIANHICHNLLAGYAQFYLMKSLIDYKSK